MKDVSRTVKKEHYLWWVPPMGSSARLSMVPAPHRAGQLLPSTLTSLFFFLAGNWTACFLGPRASIPPTSCQKVTLPTASNCIPVKLNKCCGFFLSPEGISLCCSLPMPSIQAFFLFPFLHSCFSPFDRKNLSPRYFWDTKPRLISGDHQHPR